MAKREKKQKKGIRVIDILIAIIILVVAIIIGKNVISKDKNKTENNTQVQNTEQYVTVLEDGTKLNNSNKISENKKLEGLEITDTQLTYNNGVTNLLANVKNTTQNKIEMQQVTIILLDAQGNKIYEVPGVIEAVEAGKTIQFNSSITADFANAYDFKIVKK